jgi:hypothetical protein
MVNDRSATSS